MNITCRELNALLVLTVIYLIIYHSDLTVNNQKFQNNDGGGIGLNGIISIIFGVIVLGVGAYILYKKNKELQEKVKETAKANADKEEVTQILILEREARRTAEQAKREAVEAVEAEQVAEQARIAAERIAAERIAAEREAAQA